MSKMLICVFAFAAAIGAVAVVPACAEPDAVSEETVQTTVDFDQVFADVAAASTLDPDAENEFREKLYRAALQSINAITYAEWVSARETAGIDASRPAGTVAGSE
jgi:hypothetical protein